MLTLIVFLVVLSVIILVHEFGHFISAKIFGVKVEEFAIGFPPRLFCAKYGETKYCVNLILLGGYAKLYGEEGTHGDESKSFVHKPVWQRFIIAVSGVTMNLVLASLLISIGLWLGMAPLTTSPEKYFAKSVSDKVFIAQVEAGSPAASADLRFGDVVKSADQKTFSDVAEFRDFTKSNAGKTFNFQIQRQDEIISKTITLRSKVNQGPLGVIAVDEQQVKYPWWVPLYAGPVEAIKGTVLVAKILGSIVVGLFKTGQVSGDVTGPVGIYSITGQAVRLGFVYLAQLVALISINLAVINSIPFPALDGGRILFLLIERIRRKRIKPAIENAIHMIGFALLLVLIVLITYRDIVRIFHK